MGKHFSIITNTIRERIVESAVLMLLLLSGIILILAGVNWAWGCFILSAIDLIVVVILFLNISKDIYNETVERIIQETVERLEKPETD